MKKRIVRVVALLMASILILGMLSACGAGGGGTTTNGTGTTDSTTATDGTGGTVLNIAIFEGGYGRAYWEELVKQFEAANEGVTVNMDISPDIGNILATQVAVGDFPDFISLPISERSGVTASMLTNREMLDITDIFDQDVVDRPGTKLRDVIVSGVLESSSVAPYGDGKIYQAPLNVGPMGLIYNRNLFDTKGWSTPSTWDEFFALDLELQKTENYVDLDGNAVKRSLITYPGIYAGYLESLFWPSIAGAGGMAAIHKIEQYEEGSFTQQPVQSVLEQFAKIGTNDYLMEGTVGLDHTQSQTDMLLGKALFIPNGLWLEGEMENAPREAGFEFGMIPAPKLTAGDKNYVMSSLETVFIPAQAPNVELAKEFVRFIYSEASIKAFAELANGTIPVDYALDIAGNLLSSGVASMYDVYKTGEFMLMNFATLPANTMVNIQSVVFDDTMGPLITGTLSIEEYTQIIEDAFAEIRADMAAEQ